MTKELRELIKLTERLLNDNNPFPVCSIKEFLISSKCRLPTKSSNSTACEDKTTPKDK
tara:strand:+ start:275 stop:448 length:174 start_codon:yes stop_codon:yes gene_type:complete